MSEQLVARVGRVAGAHGGGAYSFQVRFEAYELDLHLRGAPTNEWGVQPPKKLLSTRTNIFSY